jgi:hypothetical protein
VHLPPIKPRPVAQLAKAVTGPTTVAVLLFKKKFLEGYGIVTEKLLPELPVVITVLGAEMPALEVSEVTFGVGTGFATFQVIFPVQLLFPEVIEQPVAFKVFVDGAFVVINVTSAP